MTDNPQLRTEIIELGHIRPKWKGIVEDPMPDRNDQVAATGRDHDAPAPAAKTAPAPTAREAPSPSPLPSPSPIPAVAEASTENVWNADFFKGKRCTLPQSRHNMVLKNLRFLCKELKEETVDLMADEECDYKLVVHSKVPGETTNFWFDEDKTFSWSWHTMISHLRDADIDFVCANMGRLDKQQDQEIERSDPGMGKGQDRSCGIVKCVFSAIPGSYDHPIHHADVELERFECVDETELVWTFLLTRSDGSQIRLKPSHGSNEVKVYPACPSAFEVPSKGRGAKSGPKGFKKHLEQRMAGYVRFDSTKKAFRVSNEAAALVVRQLPAGSGASSSSAVAEGLIVL